MMQTDGQSLDQIFSFALKLLEPTVTSIDNKSERITARNAVVKKKKNRLKQYYIPVHSMPRILKRDIRREYGRMLVNVLNLGDEMTFTNFFTTFCDKPNCYFTILHSSRLQVSTRPAVIYTNGITSSVGQILKDLAPTPDFVFTLESAQILRKSELTGCQILLNMTVASTLLYTQEFPTDTQTQIDYAEHFRTPHYYYHHENFEKENSKQVVSKKPRLVETDDNEMINERIDLRPICRNTILHIVDTNQQQVQGNGDEENGNGNDMNSIQETLIPCPLCQQIQRKYLPVPYANSVMLRTKLYLNDCHQLSHMEVFYT